jgi:Zinc carboxypeptidase
MKHLTLTVIAILLIVFAAVGQDYKVNLRWDHYYSNQQAQDALQQLAKEHNHFATLSSIGQSEEGREIWMLEINNPKTGKDLDKPGIYIDGAIHGNEIQATEVCLYFAWYLLENYDKIETIRDIVDNNAFYIIPTVNVDSRGRFFEDAGGYGIGRTARVPYDDDRDGLADEDDYDDIDGDGEILQMRIKDPTGPYKSHPDEPRLMIRRKPWEQGEWRLIGREGIDNDGDGRINEDIPGYLDMNRNYGGNWQPSYVQNGSGDYPMSANDTYAIGQFLLTKPNLAFNWSFHNHGGMILRGPGSDLDGAYPPSDVKVFDYLGEEGEKILPGYEYLISMEDLYTTFGDFDSFMYQTFGVLGFVQELHSSSDDYYRTMEDDEWIKDEDVPWGMERLRFNDNVAQGEMFKDWTKVNHPQLGEIEIGGWRTFTTRLEQPFQLQDMVHRNSAHILFTAKHTPVIELKITELEEIGNGLTRIRARASNRNAIPTLTAMAWNKNLARRDIFSLQGRGIEVVSGGIVLDKHLDVVRHEEHQPGTIYTKLTSFGHVDVQWIVKGEGKATISYQSVKAVDQEVTVSF